MMVSPTYKQCNKVFSEVKNAIQNTVIFSGANESSLIIKFYNGSQIVFASGESSISALQGYTIKNGILIFDETAYLTDDIIQALTPAVDVYKCPVLFTSTPRFRSGTFYDYYINGANKNFPNIKSYNWKGHSMISPEKMEFYRKTLPKNTFTNYYIGEFTTVGDGVFGDFTNVLSNEFETGLDLYMGVDWGTGTDQDYTAISIFNSKYQQIYIEQFNNLDETETISRIINIIKRFKPVRVQVETNSIGRIFYGLLQKEINNQNIEIRVSGFNTSNDSKMELISHLQVAIQNNEVQLLDDENLKLEMNTYEAKLSSSGKVTYNAHQGMHDDLIIATLLSYDCIGKGHYCVL